jgi:hypothetical protein
MDLKSNDSAAVQGTAPANNTPKTTIVNASAKLGAGKADNTPKPNEQGKAENHNPTGAAAKAPEEPKGKEEIKSVAQLPPVEQAKPVMSIIDRLKALEELQVRKTQYENLLERIKDLEDFEFKQIEENDELQENHFAGCRIILQDGNKGQFTTTTPNLVRMVHAYLKAACLDKKAELEDIIVFPAA